MSQTLTIALTKGRILEETLPLLAAAGIEPLEDMEKSRKLVFDTTQVANVRLLLLRGADVPTYVQFGAADMGISGKDTLMENGAEGLYEPLDLNIARCKLMTAGVKGESRYLRAYSCRDQIREYRQTILRLARSPDSTSSNFTVRWSCLRL